MKMKKIVNILVLCALLCSCGQESTPTPVQESKAWIAALDLSSYPEIAAVKPVFYDQNGNQKDFLLIVRESGINTVRLRLWVEPANGHSGFEEVRRFAEILKTNGFKIWLTVHYSDTWADPSQQRIPLRWQKADRAALEDSVGAYTQKIVRSIQPDYIQIGNEINTGFLHPYGHLTKQYEGFIALMNKAIRTVREHSKNTQIMIHFAGLEHTDWFFEQVKGLDYDLIGLSYYPIWHTKMLTDLKSKMQFLSEKYQKKILIAETAYPFTLEWNDWTNNIVGLNEHLILPDYPSSVDGQKNFVKKIRTLTQELDKGVGICYWGGELVAWRGNQALEGSVWENQALFDFQFRALPALQEIAPQ